MPKKITYSVIIPLFNEEESLVPLWEEIKVAMTNLGGSWELIFANDGSTDGSRQVIEKIAKDNANVRVVNLHHNQGKSAVLMASFQRVQGDIVITMDADLQDDPHEIPKLLAKLNEGYDLVSGYKKDRHDPIHKTIPSHIFNALIRWTTHTPLHDINCGFKMYRRPVIDSLYLYGELYRFIPVLADSEGFSLAEVVVNHRARKFGKSKFGISRFTRGLFDLMTITFRTRFLKRPLHFFGSLGVITLLAGFIICIYMTYVKFAQHVSIGRRPLLMLGVLLIISGIQLVCTGLLAELITFYNQRNELRLKAELAKHLLKDDNS
jgi:glycosyltransferase involved in cell wall biosynthesis